MRKDYTVIISLPYDIRQDQACAADEVSREHVMASDPESAYQKAVFQHMHRNVLQDTRDEDEYAPIAVFPGHLVDEYPHY